MTQFLSEKKLSFFIFWLPFFLVLNQIQFEMKKINYRPTSSMWISKLDLIFFKFTFFLKPRVTIGKITEINFQTFLFRESKSETNKIWSLSKNNIKIKFCISSDIFIGKVAFYLFSLYSDSIFDQFDRLVTKSLDQFDNLIIWSIWQFDQFDHLISLTIWSLITWSFK